MADDKLSTACESDDYAAVWAILESSTEPTCPADFKRWEDKGKSNAALALREHAGVIELKAHNPAAAAIELKACRRFLRARQHDVRKAAALLAADIAWRSEIKPEEITQASIPTALPTGSWRSLGVTGAGLPVLWVQVGRWQPHLYSLEEYVAYVVYFLERLTHVGERFIVLLDMAGWRFSHALQLRKVGALIKTLQEHYPERLEAARLLHTPGIFSAAWKLIRPLIDPVTAAKVVFVASGEECSALKELGMPPELIPSTYGGSLEVATIPVPNLPGEPNITVISN